MHPWILLLWQNRVIWVPRKNLKFAQNANIFFNQWATSANFYTRILVHSLVEIMEFRHNCDHFYFLTLNNGCKNNMVNFHWKGTIFFSYLHWTEIFDYQILGEFMKLKFKRSFISLVQVTQFYDPINDFLYIWLKVVIFRPIFISCQRHHIKFHFQTFQMIFIKFQNSRTNAK